MLVEESLKEGEVDDVDAIVELAVAYKMKTSEKVKFYHYSKKISSSRKSVNIV